MGPLEINQFLVYLSSEKEVSSSTQNQALSAILFLYRHVLFIEMYTTKNAFPPGTVVTVNVRVSDLPGNTTELSESKTFIIDRSISQ